VSGTALGGSGLLSAPPPILNLMAGASAQVMLKIRCNRDSAGGRQCRLEDRRGLCGFVHHSDSWHLVGFTGQGELGFEFPQRQLVAENFHKAFTFESCFYLDAGVSWLVKRPARA